MQVLRTLPPNLSFHISVAGTDLVKGNGTQNKAVSSAWICRQTAVVLLLIFHEVPLKPPEAHSKICFTQP